MFDSPAAGPEQTGENACFEGGHLSTEAIEQYSVGRLPISSRAMVEEHLLACGACQELLRSEDDFTRVFSQAVTSLPLRSTAWERIRSFTVNPLWAAGFAMFILSIPFFMTWSRGGKTGVQDVDLRAVRGLEDEGRVSSDRPIRLVFADEEAGENCGVKILNRDGGTVKELRADEAASRNTALVGRLASGAYWVRLYCGNEHKLMAEYNLDVK